MSNITGSLNASAATSTRPIKVAAANPATCYVGEVLFRSDETPGQNVYLCADTNTWVRSHTAIAAGAGMVISGGTAAVDTTVVGLYAAQAGAFTGSCAAEYAAGIRFGIDTSTSALYACGGSSWAAVSPSISPRQSMIYREEFVSGAAWTIRNCTVACATGQPTVEQGFNRLGVAKITTTTTANSQCFFHISNGNSGQVGLLSSPAVAGSGVTWEGVGEFRTDASAVTSSAYSISFGALFPTTLLGSSTSFGVGADTTNATSCSAGTTTVTAGRLFFFNLDGGAYSYCYDTGVNIAANTWYTVQLKATAANEVQVFMSVNGGALTAYGTHTVTTPSGGVNPYFMVQNQASTARSIYVDYFAARIFGVARGGE